MSKAEEWSARLSRHDPRESIAAFCRREGVSTASFYYWRRRVGARFVEVSVAPSAPLVVEVGDARIEVPVHFDAAHLRAVVDALL
jgi:transposase-like protein